GKREQELEGQGGRAVWGEEGGVVYYVSAAGTIYKICADTTFVLATATPAGGASSQSLHLLPANGPLAVGLGSGAGAGAGAPGGSGAGEGCLLVAAGKELLLIPCDSLDVALARSFGSNVSVGPRGQRFWGTCVAGIVHGVPVNWH
ncbi:unnamed protein product, partial [Discosporangium mesarthrocarpum]